jgi:hypothetical protein
VQVLGGGSDELEIGSSATLLLEVGSSLELELGSSAMLLLEVGLSLELELGLLLELELGVIGSLSEPEHANSVKTAAAERMVLLIMVLPRNIVAKHLVMLRTLASFPASVFDRHGSGTALDFHKVTLLR